MMPSRPTFSFDLDRLRLRGLGPRTSRSPLFFGMGFVLSIAILLAGCSVQRAAEPLAEIPQPVIVKPEAVNEMAPEIIEAPPKEPEAAELVDANNIFFASGATDVGVRGKAKLKEHAERLKDDAGGYITLVGHTDDLGSRNYNLALAEQRIQAVSKELRRYGVRAKQIRRYRGDGERVPNSCTSSECRQKMRRVEIVLPHH